jgi:hypothetical protein
MPQLRLKVMTSGTLSMNIPLGELKQTIIIIIIISCYLLWDIGREQNVAIWSYLWPSFSPRSISSLFLMPHCGLIFATSA